MRHGWGQPRPCTIHEPFMDKAPGCARPIGCVDAGDPQEKNRMPQVAGSVKELIAALNGIVKIEGAGTMLSRVTGFARIAATLGISVGAVGRIDAHRPRTARQQEDLDAGDP